MSNIEEKINWEEIFNFYNTIKWLYALCEETDSQLYTNLQPLNEFRAALDHVMRIVAIENLNEYKNKSAVDEAKKLRSHLRRAFFDICDMVSINYRNKIINALQNYAVEEIQSALPTYYSEIRPRIEAISEEIASLRTGKRFNCSDEETAVDVYPELIKELQAYYGSVNASLPSLIEIRQRNSKKRRSNFIVQWIIPIVSIVVAIIAIFA